LSAGQKCGASVVVRDKKTWGATNRSGWEACVAEWHSEGVQVVHRKRVLRDNIEQIPHLGIVGKAKNALPTNIPQKYNFLY
jgi:hypothetical protein